ncbi:MAG: glycosyltransferase family 4 protein [Actinomycetota bacterium]
MTAVDLLVPELREHDATGAHTLLLRDLLADHGAGPIRFVTQIPTTTAEEVTLVDDWKAPADLVILQHGIGSFVAEAVIQQRVPCVLNYHNITPAEFLEPWDPGLIPGLRWGRSQLDQLAPFTIRAVADSAYNAAELRAVGIDDVRVSPVMWRLGGDGPAPADDREPIVLFVGRVVSNKRHEDLVASMAMVHDAHPDARLVLVGSPSIDAYGRALTALIDRLGLGDVVEFTGPVSDAELAAWYRRASVFLCLSEHEGFCVPVVEAMAAGLPVVGFRAAAVPETIAGAGIVLGDKRPVTVAEAVGRLLADPTLWGALAEAGARRAGDFALDRTQVAMWDALQGLVR